MEQSEIKLIRTAPADEAGILKKMEAALTELQSRVTGIYLHIDMDAFEIGGGAANHYGATGGISQDFMLKAIALVRGYIPIKGCAIASYDPSFDRDGKFVEAGIQSIRKIVST